MSGLRAIKTEYRGVIFRSRAEARWAVMFDLIEVKWLYEYEGFDLPSGWYLPDFWLPNIDVFAEVKGVAAQFTTDALRKTDELATASGKAVLLLSDLFDQENSLLRATSGGGPTDYVDLVTSAYKGRAWYEWDDPFAPYLMANGEREREQWRWCTQQAVGYFNNDGRYVP